MNSDVVQCEVITDTRVRSVPGWGHAVPLRGMTHVTCLRCSHRVHCVGADDPALVRRLLRQLRSECPNGEANTYVRED
jgi:hypothetical protein